MNEENINRAILQLRASGRGDFAESLDAALKEKDREIARWKARADRYRKALEAIRDHERIEVCKDDFAYDRMVEAYRDAARTILEDEKEVMPSEIDT